MQAISYIRFSHASQASGNSYQRQQEAVVKWIEKNPGYTLSSLSFEDLGRSGFHGEHTKKGGGWAKLLTAVEAGVVKDGDAVLVEAFDRTGRQETVDALHYINPILRAGVSIITLDDGSVFNRESVNGTHVFLLVAKIQAAHGYSKILSERTKASYQIRREQAKKGEPIKRMVPMWLNTDGTLKHEVAVQVTEAFKLYVAGMGKLSIANKLRRSGVEALVLCSGPTVEGWLRNRTVLGYWGDIPDVYPAIVPAELFYLAQKKQEERRKERPEKMGKQFLVGLVKCGVCGGNYIFNNVGGVPYSMRCGVRQRLKDEGCSNTKNMPKNVLEFVRLTTSLTAVQKALQKGTISLAEKRRLEIEEQLSSLSKKVGKLVLLAMEDEEGDEVGVMLTKLRGERKTLQAELGMIQEGNVEDQERVNVATVEKGMIENDPLLLNAMLRSVGYTITVFPDGTITCSEEKSTIKYLGVKRKVQSNVTDWLRLSYSSERVPGKEFIFKINQDPLIDIVSQSADTLANIETPTPGRWGVLTLGVE